MNDFHILSLIEEIDNIDFREFWWGSNLLERCSKDLTGNKLIVLV